jgi:hypothetical protein
MDSCRLFRSHSKPLSAPTKISDVLDHGPVEHAIKDGYLGGYAETVHGREEHERLLRIRRGDCATP